MPLIPHVPPTEDVEVDGDVYTLKTMISFYDREQTRGMQGLKMQVPMNKVRNGQVDENEMVDVTLDDATVMLKKIRIWLAGWSHPDTLTSANIRRIPPKHAQILIKRIKELEDIQMGVQDGTPQPSS